jgi:NTE family protein
MRHSVRSSAWLRRLAIGLALLAPLACVQAAEPPSEPHATSERPRIGLVLGGGGARGGAHIGVLKVLDELRVPVDCVAGTSMGALVGATFAAGALPARIEREFLAIDWVATLTSEGRRPLMPMQRKLAGITYSNNIQFSIGDGRLRGDGGVLSTQNIEALLRQLVGDARRIEDFDALPIPFRAVATDLGAGEMVVLDSGDLTRAMRASMAVPGVFAPVVIGDQVLADGGMIRNLPVDVARELCADVSIVVAFDLPLPPTEELQSIFALTGRSIDAMIIANERAQLATLTTDDVAIRVPVGDIGTGDFARVSETIPLGEAAARSVTNALRRYALPETEYRRWRAQLARPEPAPVRIAEIDFAPLRHASADYLTTRMATRAGDDVTLAELETDMSRLFASGDFTRVDYRLRPRPGGGQALEINAVERPGGNDFLRFDLGLSGSSGGDVLFALRADHRREWINPLGGQWRNALQLGQLSELGTTFYQPLDVPQRFFVEAGLAARRTLEDIFVDGDRAARFDLLAGEMHLDIGVNLGNHARVRTAARWGLHEYKPDIGTVDIVALDTTRDASVAIGAIYDTRDAAALPSSGSYAALEYASSGDWFGGQQSYEIIEAVAGHSMPWRHTLLVLAVGAGNTLDGDLPRYRDFQVGGIRSFPALSRGELRGEGYWSASATWLLRVGDSRALFGQMFYAGFGLQAVNVSDRLDGIKEGTVLGASFTVGARTFAGPLMLSLGAADNGSVTIHLALGRPISEGSMLDRLH